MVGCAVTRRQVGRMIWLVLVIYIGAVAGLYFAQRFFLYQPRHDLQAPQAYGLDGFAVVTLTAEDGVALTSWQHVAAEGMPTVLYFHGNGGHLGYRAAMYGALQEAGFGVLALSYRGYGTSSGRPDEAGLLRDARAMYAYATETLHLPPSRLIAYGESLGTGVAVALASEHPVRLVALQSPYRSVAARAAEIYWFAPAEWLVKDRFDTLARLPMVDVPVLVMHGMKDRIIPFAHGEAVYEAVSSAKYFKRFDGYGHNNLPPEELVSALTIFAVEHGLIVED